MFRRLLYAFSLLAAAVGCGPSANHPSRLRIQIESYPESFSPLKTNVFDGIIFQFLTERDSAQRLVSNITKIDEKIIINDTITLFGFALNKGVKWKDGHPLTKEDVELTLKLSKTSLARDATSSHSTLYPIKKFISDSTREDYFQIEVHGNSEFGRAIAGDYLIMPEHIFDPDQILRKYSLEQLSNLDEANAPEDLRQYFDWFNQIHPYDSSFFSGSGPYKIESYNPDQNLTLGLVPNWWKTVPKDIELPSKIDYVVISDPTAARFALQNEEIDLMTQIPANEFVQLEKFNEKNNRLNLYREASFRFIFVGFNTRLKKFTDAKTRRALAHLLDKQAIVDAVRLGYGQQTVGPIHPVLTDLYNDKIKPYDYDLAEAKQGLIDAGWKLENEKWIDTSGEPLAFDITYDAANTDYEKIALILKDEARKIGLTVNLVPDEHGSVLKRLKSHQFESTIYSFAGSPRAFDFAPPFHTKSAQPGGWNFCGFGNQESDKLIEAAVLSTNRGALAEKLKALQESLHDECPMIFLYFEQNLIAASKKFPRLNITYYKPGYDPVGVF